MTLISLSKARADRQDIIAAMARKLVSADVRTEDAAMRVLSHAKFRGGDIVTLLDAALDEAQLLRTAEAMK